MSHEAWARRGTSGMSVSRAYSLLCLVRDGLDISGPAALSLLERGLLERVLVRVMSPKGRRLQWSWSLSNDGRRLVAFVDEVRRYYDSRERAA